MDHPKVVTSGCPTSTNTQPITQLHDTLDSVMSVTMILPTLQLSLINMCSTGYMHKG